MCCLARNQRMLSKSEWFPFPTFPAPDWGGGLVDQPAVAVDQVGHVLGLRHARAGDRQQLRASRNSELQHWLALSSLRWQCHVSRMVYKRFIKGFLITHPHSKDHDHDENPNLANNSLHSLNVREVRHVGRLKIHLYIARYLHVIVLYIIFHIIHIHIHISYSCWLM